MGSCGGGAQPTGSVRRLPLLRRVDRSRRAAVAVARHPLVRANAARLVRGTGWVRRVGGRHRCDAATSICQRSPHVPASLTTSHQLTAAWGWRCRAHTELSSNFFEQAVTWALIVLGWQLRKMVQHRQRPTTEDELLEGGPINFA